MISFFPLDSLLHTKPSGLFCLFLSFRKAQIFMFMSHFSTHVCVCVGNINLVHGNDNYHFCSWFLIFFYFFFISADIFPGSTLFYYHNYHYVVKLYRTKIGFFFLLDFFFGLNRLLSCFSNDDWSALFSLLDAKWFRYFGQRKQKKTRQR